MQDPPTKREEKKDEDNVGGSEPAAYEKSVGFLWDRDITKRRLWVGEKKEGPGPMDCSRCPCNVTKRVAEISEKEWALEAKKGGSKTTRG